MKKLTKQKVREKVNSLAFEDEKEGKVARLLVANKDEDWTEMMEKWFLALIERKGKKFQPPEKVEIAKTEK